MGHVKSGAREKKVVSRERGEEWVWRVIFSSCAVREFRIRVV
jgi:hypothetical protein